MERKVLSVAVVVAVFGAVFTTGISSAGTTRAETKVTIRTENGDFWGQVKSPRPGRCAEGRKVVVFKQTGPEQDPSVDLRKYNDTASLNGDRYEWNTGNTGVNGGRYYARVARTAECKADTSRTVRV